MFTCRFSSLNDMGLINSRVGFGLRFTDVLDRAPQDQGLEYLPRVRGQAALGRIDREFKGSMSFGRCADKSYGAIPLSSMKLLVAVTSYNPSFPRTAKIGIL